MTVLRSLLRVFPSLNPLARALRSSTVLTSVPNGHFYSPVVNPKTIKESEDSIWSGEVTTTPGLVFNDDSHETILQDWFPRHIEEYIYPEEQRSDAPATEYFSLNEQFGHLDSRALLVFLCELKPSRVIEVGSGFSSLLIADINQRLLRNQIDYRCIDPYPRLFLKQGLPGLVELIEEPVQALPVEFFDQLQKGDFLFIDSSHVCKTASDVHYLFSQVFPRLKPGVYIHIHDIYLPEEYPKLWVLTENRSWNEQYVLNAIMANSDRFEIVFGSNYAMLMHLDKLADVIRTNQSSAFGGSSFWIRRTEAA